ncbi:hypothetical protein [Pradoshia sp.]
MKISVKKITQYFKTDTEVFFAELNDYRQSLEDVIKALEQDIHILQLALTKHRGLVNALEEQKASMLIRMQSINKNIIQYVKMGNDEAAKEMVREKVKEQQKLQSLSEIADMQNQRIQDYQLRLKKTISMLDNHRRNREAFIIKQQIAIQELTISRKLDKRNSKKHIERIQREILDEDIGQSIDLKEDTQIDGLIEKELSLFKMNYAANNL